MPESGRLVVMDEVVAVARKRRHCGLKDCLATDAAVLVSNILLILQAMCWRSKA